MSTFDGLDDVFGTEPAELETIKADKPKLKKSETQEIGRAHV